MIVQVSARRHAGCASAFAANGDTENRLRELKAGPELDRLSCQRFVTNQFRVLLASVA